MKSLNYFVFFIIFAFSVASCKQDKHETKVETTEQKPNKPAVKIPKVDQDSLYSFTEKQVNFGVRVPGSEGHLKTRDWIVEKMRSYGADVQLQEFKATFLTKKDVQSYNIIAKINPEHKERVILFAHWDTRLIAEKDKDVAKQDKPILGAVDGASGVAALIEIARQLKINPIDLGVDFVFFDAEDQGSGGDNTWCLGSQYWSKGFNKNDIKPQFGILLDLVGAKGAQYSKEAVSATYAGAIQDKVWDIAHKMGKANLFLQSHIDGITDDHYYVNTIAGIPTIDIIQTYPSGIFAPYHHTHDDNLDAIDKENLAAVTQVVLAVVCKTSDGTF